MSIEGEDFKVACVDSRFDVANRPLKKCSSNLGPSNFFSRTANLSSGMNDFDVQLGKLSHTAAV